MSIELTAPVTFILTKFQTEKCHMCYVSTICHAFHACGIYPGPYETAIYRSGVSGIARKVPEPSSNTPIFRKLALRAGKMECVSENTLLLKVSNLNGVVCTRVWKVDLQST